MQHRYSRLALYNSWANDRLYDAVACVSDADYRADRGAFFKSLHGTLNHLLVGDRVWMRRFTGKGDAPMRLDAILYEDFHDLRRARETEDRLIQTYVDGLGERTLNSIFNYSTITNPAKVEQVLSEALDHFFNHQTHHRGQAHCLLTAITGTAPSLDLVILQREKGWAKKQ
ncbi:MAG: damage-inducible protein DinB [Hyphomicrobiales bacterium]|nr:damage-inducible protein DinB [Hyphomicrobiales bacterium]MBV9112070.1 damage-inducible protein DinB [Hyphomicrobiales bacterium]